MPPGSRRVTTIDAMPEGYGTRFSKVRRTSPNRGRSFLTCVVMASSSLLTACATTVAPTTVPATTAAPAPDVKDADTSVVTTAVPTTTTEADLVLPEGWSWAAVTNEDLEVFAEPVASEPFTVLSGATHLGSPRVVHLIGTEENEMLPVMVPARPNGTTGWVRSEDVVLFPVERSVAIDLSDRTLVVYKGTEPELTTRVAIGRSANPTPTGQYFITDSVILSNPGGPWGPHAFGLSAFSDTITEFNGSDAVVGIHGTNAPKSIGSAASLGCIRVPNDVVQQLATMLSAGIPVTISA